MHADVSRRTFVFTSAAASASFAQQRSATQPNRNGEIRLGLIGCGARGRTVIIPAYTGVPGVRFTAVCDVNRAYREDAARLLGNKGVALYGDYRKLLDDSNVDAVIIATNAQWHVLPMIHACQAGKDVFLEKPLGQSIGEGPYAIAAARKYGRIVEVGTQQRSHQHYQQAVEIIQSGKLGEISEVRVWDYENLYPGPGFPADTAPPEELDWDFYVGPSPFRNYNPNMYYKYGYDWFRIAGAGHQVAWGVHHFDIVLWAMQQQWPSTIYATGGNFAFASNHDYPNTFSGTVTFGPGPVAKHGFLLQYTMRAGGKREARAHGKCFIGTEASMILDRAGFSIVRELPPGQRLTATGPYVNAEQVTLPADDHRKHFQVFIEAIRSRKPSPANVETLHQATTVGHLMNISWEVGRAITWDAAKQQIANDSEANGKVMRPYRAPWKLEP
jgi:predicted dehydrogenase